MYNFHMDYLAYINGKFTKTTTTLEIINPANNMVAGSVSALTADEINLAYESATNALTKWKDLPLLERKKFIIKFNELLIANKNEIAKIMNAEIAKSIPESIIEIERTYDYINKTIKEWDSLNSTSTIINKLKVQVLQVPLGVVLAISPFNYPINLSLAKIIPALLIGNTVVFKPATNGSLTGAFLGRLFDEAKFPNGTINIITGRGRDIGDILTSHRSISMITFTGGVKVGKQVSKAQDMIPIVLELGGNDLAYVRADADLIKTAKEIAKGAFSFAGQRCTAIKRLLVHSKIKSQFIPLLLDEIKSLKNNPLISMSAAAYVEELINDSRVRGDHFLLEGNRIGNEISFHVVETTTTSRAWQEEAFGPLLPIVYIDNEKDLVEIINATEYGLQNSLFTSDIKWAQKIAPSLECGTVNINRSSSRGPDELPFTGIKNSGFGTQGIKFALLSMSRSLTVVENE